MNYALIQNGAVENVIWLYPQNAAEFPNAMPTGDLPVAIGDTWKDGEFLRNGERVMSALEMSGQRIQQMQKEMQLMEVGSDV